MNGVYVVDDVCENCRVTADGNELLWRQARVEKNGGKLKGWGKRAEKESWRRRLHSRLQAQGGTVGRVGIRVRRWAVVCGRGRTQPTSGSARDGEMMVRAALSAESMLGLQGEHLGYDLRLVGYGRGRD